MPREKLTIDFGAENSISITRRRTIPLRNCNRKNWTWMGKLITELSAPQSKAE
jgi:hypothetical protein